MRLVSAFLVALTCSCLSAQTNGEVHFCTSGIQPDGFVDWTKLPTPPVSGPLTATLPVSGVPDLTATFQLPGASVNYGQGNGYYQVINSADLTLSLGSNPTITFSRPVRGITVTFRIGGRFGHSFQMLASSTAGVVMPAFVPAEVGSSGLDSPGLNESLATLQIRSGSADLVSVTFQTDADSGEYFFYDLRNLRIETGADPAVKLPQQGLREWLRADTTNLVPYGPYGSPLVSWPDQSGHGSDAYPPNPTSAPYSLSDGPNCTQVIAFNNSRLNFNLPINGWTAMTVFLASQSFADAGGWWENQPLFWGETQPWGATFFTPSQTNAFFRFGTTQANNQPIYSRPLNIGGDFSVTTAVHDATTDSLYINGLLALRQSGKHAAISGATPTATIGAGLSDTFFTGNIGEILVYDRALTVDERALVEHYLMNKFGVH